MFETTLLDMGTSLLIDVACKWRDQYVDYAYHRQQWEGIMRTWYATNGVNRKIKASCLEQSGTTNEWLRIWFRRDAQNIWKRNQDFEHVK